jgi:hypothetical protein
VKRHIKAVVRPTASSYKTFIFNSRMAEPVVRHFLLFIFNLIFNGGRVDYNLDKYGEGGWRGVQGQGSRPPPPYHL